MLSLLIYLHCIWSVRALTPAPRESELPSMPFRMMGGPRFREAMESEGIVAITDVPWLKDIHTTTMLTLDACQRANPSLFTVSTLQDGTTRATLASETRGGTSAALDSRVKARCPEFVKNSKALRALVTRVSKGFIRAFDQGLGPVAMPRDGTNANSAYDSLEKALQNSQHLDHFHAYRGAESKDTQVVDGTSDTDVQYSIDLHTDDGLFIALIPALSVVSSSSRLSAEIPSNHGFYVQLNNGETIKPIFADPHSLVFMLGGGMSRWVEKKGGAPGDWRMGGVPHAVMVETKENRMWYGRMFLPPSDALANDMPLTFGDYREYQLNPKDNVENLARIGCIQADGQRGMLDVQDAKCNDNEFHCWMRCYPSSNYTCQNHEHLACLNPSTGQTCDPEKMGCQPVCVEDSATGFCNSDYAVSMYMDGFTNPTADANQACVVFLFKNWTLDSKAKFAGACIGTILAGIALEALIALRRRLRDKKKTRPPSKAGLYISEGLFYGVQTTLGYFLMLIAMTFSSPLFACVVIGLLIGHLIFNLNAPVPEGATPCCEGTSLVAPEGKVDEMDQKGTNYTQL